MRLYVVTCGSGSAYKNYQKTVSASVPLSNLNPYLRGNEISELKQTLSKSTKAVSMWGFSDPRQETRWRKMEYGDIVYFYRKRQFFLSARIVYTVKNIALANKEWGLDVNTGRPFKYIFFLDDLSKVSVPQKTFNRIAGSKPNDYHLFGKIYESPKSDLVLKRLNAKKYKQQRRSSSKNKKGPAKRKYVKVPQYVRDKNVITHVLEEAKGYCDLCHKQGPFKKDGAYFLECHHVKRLADKGDDDISNAVALCPNCHRKVHSLDLKKDKALLKRRIRSRDSKRKSW